MLHSYDLITQKEEVCKNGEGHSYVINEHEQSSGHVQEDGTRHFNLNVTFSKEFGRKLSAEDMYDNDEIRFLDDQYLCTQAYIEKSENKEYSLYRLGELSKPIHHTAATEVQDPNAQDETMTK